VLHVVVLHAASAAVMASSASVPIGALVMDVKLTGQNYRDWAFSFKMLLRSVGLASHLTDEPPVAVVNDKAAQDWSLQDDRVMAAICLNTDLSIRLCLEDYNTAKAMWNYLQGRYQQSSSALRYSLRQNLHHLQQQDMEIEEYYIAFTKLSSQHASMVPKPSSLCTGCVSSWATRDKYDQENTMFDFVMGLRSEFEPIRVQLLGRPTLPTLSETLSALLAEETRLKTLTSNSPVSQHSVLKLQQQPLLKRLLAAIVAGQIILMCGVSRSILTSWLKCKPSVLPHAGEQPLLVHKQQHLNSQQQHTSNQHLSSNSSPAVPSLLLSVHTCQLVPCPLHHIQVLFFGCWILELLFI